MQNYRKEVELEVVEIDNHKMVRIGHVVLWRVWEQGKLAIDLTRAEINWLKAQRIDILR